MKRAKVTVAVDEKAGLLIESARAAARLFVHEDDDGGLYFEVAMEHGGRIFVPKTISVAGRSQLCTISGADHE